MKLIVFLTFVAVISAAPATDGPSQISNNNVGNIVNVDVQGSLKYNNQVNAFLMSFLLGSINQQSLAVVAPPAPQTIESETIEQKITHIEPKTLEKLYKALSHKN